MILDVERLVKILTKPSKRFFISTPLPTLNEYTDATRAHKQASAAMKRRAEEAIMWEARSQLGKWKAERPVFVVFHWVEKNKRRDHDNVAFAKKFVFDALVKMGVLKGDGWKHVDGFLDAFSVDAEHAGLEVFIVEVTDEQ